MVEIPVYIRLRIEAAWNGDASAMGSVFEWFRPRLYAHALHICRNPALAQDAVQDTFIAAFTHLSSLRDVELFYPWLKRILVNNCYLLLRKERSTELTDQHLALDLLLHRPVDEHFENLSNAQRLYESMRFLSDELRSCVLLRYFSSFKSYENISCILNIPVGTVRSRLSAAREKLSMLFNRNQDAGDEAWREARHWSGFYRHQWNNLHSDPETRNVFFNHFHPSLSIYFTSGKMGKGRRIIENEINNDLLYGSLVAVSEVVSSGNISIIEVDNINHPEYPDRCAPSTAIVLFRKDQQVEVAHIFDSPRS